MVVGLMLCVQLASQAVTLPELLALSCTKNQFKHETFLSLPRLQTCIVFPVCLLCTLAGSHCLHAQELYDWLQY